MVCGKSDATLGGWWFWSPPAAICERTLPLLCKIHPAILCKHNNYVTLLEEFTTNDNAIVAISSLCDCGDLPQWYDWSTDASSSRWMEAEEADSGAILGPMVCRPTEWTEKKGSFLE